MYSLQELGWCEFFEKQLEGAVAAHPGQCSQESAFSGHLPARVAEESRGLYRILCEDGEFLAAPSGRLRHRTSSGGELLAVGDWVLAQFNENRATIHRLLQRKGKFSRKTAGRKTEEQIVAANVDVVFLVSSLNREFNPRRIERYLSLAGQGSAHAVIVLNKADLCANADAFRREALAAAPDTRVVLTSATRGDGCSELRSILAPGVTAALLGSSGVGKSSLINAILGGGGLRTQPIREGDDRGRHTTSSRQLLLVPGGGMLIDTPGMRELQLWGAADGIGRTFSEIQELAARCKFRDCRHLSEPGCAVRAAVETQALASERLENFRKLTREEQFLESKCDVVVRSKRTKELRKLMKSVNRFYRDRGR
jgi:ribosome biogenesis GTPase